MGSRPNIFEYATKELSQDAMICWFLACLKSEDEFYREIGVKFVRFILGDKKIEKDDVLIDPETLHAQYYHMDVYAVLCMKNKAIPIIFEDKTDTYLHGGQMKKYCDTVNSWKGDKYLSDIKKSTKLPNLEWGDTRYIYFKTGYVPKWQEEDVEKKEQECENVIFKNIYIDKWIAFLNDLPTESLIDDYKGHLLTKKAENGQKGNQEKWDNIYRNIFGKYVTFQSSYQGWAAKSIMYFDEGRDDRNISYSLRCGSWKKGKKGEKHSAIAFQQYRNESNIKRKKAELEEKRNENSEQIREICKDIFEKLGRDFNEYVEYNNGKDQNNIFKIFIEDNEEDVCNFFKDFLKLFINAVKEKYGDKIKITENIE